MTIIRLPAIFFIVLFFAASGRQTAGQPADEDAPRSVIQGLHELLEDTMRNADSLGIKGRYRNLEPQLMDIYDFERMTAIAAGSHWRQADAPQREKLLDAFSRFSIATYASRFSGYSGEKFEIVNERPGPRDTVLVDTRLVRADGDPIPITYVMSARSGRWRIVDVLLERTISELAVKRSEYATILDRGGPGQLAKVLQDKTAALLNE